MRSAFPSRRRIAATARMGETEFGTEHLLLGILQCGDAEAGDVLKRHGVTLTAVLDAVQPTSEMTLEAARRGYAADQQGAATTLVSPLARRVMERALTRAAAQGADHLSALDLLLSTLAHDDAGAVRTLRTLGVDPAELRAELTPRA
jgi:ATP-dependent Clp protease ATP-binding subunit ClpA